MKIELEMNSETVLGSQQNQSLKKEKIEKNICEMRKKQSNIFVFQFIAKCFTNDKIAH